MSLRGPHRPAQARPIQIVAVPNMVPEEALDYDEIFRRGGANCGDEDFALCKCPHCGRVYLMEYEVDTLYLDATDLNRRLPAYFHPQDFNCAGCGERFPETIPWVGPKSLPQMQVTWSDLAASPWRWITQLTR